MKTRNLTIEIISALFILLFLYTAISKLLDFRSFSQVLHTSPLIGNMSTFVAIGLPLAEIVVVALLFFPKTRLWGFYGSFVLMTAFTIYLAYMILFAPKLPCSCGGVISKMTWKQHLYFNIFFWLLSLTGIALKRKNKNLSSGKELPPVVFT